MEQQVNLYQPILGAQKRLFSARAIGVGLVLLVACLASLGGYGVWRTGRVERTIAALESRESSQLAAVEQAGPGVHPHKSLAELDAEAKELSVNIAARERALDLVRIGAPSVETGFAARLEALGRRQPDGLWLHNIVVGSGAGRLALRGNAVDARLVPAYLAALADEKSLAGVSFDRLSLHRAKADEAPAQLVFELGAPGLNVAAPEAHP
jgi:Tfp pilus assembly protein PilN